MKRSVTALVVAVVVACFAERAEAYTVEGGDVLVKAVTGASVNVARFDVATRATPAGGMVIGADVDWSFDGSWSLAASLRPTLSPGFVDSNVGVGARYRVLQLDAPFIPFVVAQLTSAIGGPLGYGDVHGNLGARVGGGVDYWVMRDLAVGIELTTEASALVVPSTAFEWSTDVGIGVTWRL